MHFVIYQVIQLQHIHIANGYGPRERISATTIVQRRLTVDRQPRQIEHFLDAIFFCAVKYWSRDRHSIR